VQNGDMGSATGWTLNADWTIAAGVMTHTAGTGVAIDSFTTPLVAGASYTYSIDVPVRTAGGFILRVSDGTNVQALTGTISTTGTFTGGFTASFAHNQALLVPIGFNGTVDNLSIFGPS